VGGDFYDVVRTADSCSLVVGDVSGKGAPAAAVTGLARHNLRAASLSAGSPVEVLQTLNRAILLDSRDDQYCTVLLTWVRQTERGLALDMASGGHPPGLLLRADGSTAEVGPYGAAAGWFDEPRFGTLSLELEPGDVLVLFTDGLTEAKTDSGMVGFDRVASELARSGAGSAQEAVDAIEALLETVEVRDDVAVLAIRAV
jgi:sigma-B regulation protein RsbU (phosphoserine phosphatase)